ncbi:MAG TPA: hypothetical protein VK272_11920 [Solirubrobacteraceae bacterium]|nr:hypothetical protein [Solirubrobacteraceae bacterium]
MTDQSGGGSAFSIGSQQAGAIYQSAGDQIIQQGGGTLSAGVLGAVSEVRSALAAAAPALSPADRERAEESLDAVEAELQRSEPDKTRVANGLAQVAKTLKQAGELATSAEALHQLAAWLGSAGATVLQALL